jgi:hypothetical protein
MVWLDEGALETTSDFKLLRGVTMFHIEKQQQSFNKGCGRQVLNIKTKQLISIVERSISEDCRTSIK